MGVDARAVKKYAFSPSETGESRRSKSRAWGHAYLGLACASFLFQFDRNALQIDVFRTGSQSICWSLASHWFTKRLSQNFKFKGEVISIFLWHDLKSVSRLGRSRRPAIPSVTLLPDFLTHIHFHDQGWPEDRSRANWSQSSSSPRSRLQLGVGKELAMDSL